MSVSIRPSLFDASNDASLEASLTWLQQVVFGEIALVLSVLAVAMIGALMLTGRLPIGRGLRVVLGCFILLGAPVIAGSLM